ncbi:hypothetical protein VE03_04529 [Pseudogymnoascus sp. 23342-1-I1]|nr:hypothetical protein VE03_04529 [Pseudogymnoascus sp. 23342-1-I1]
MPMPYAVLDIDLHPTRKPRVDHEVKEWSNKLKGKKLGETTDDKTFAKCDLPPGTRIIEHCQAYTLEYCWTRINIYLAEDEIVFAVDRG